MSKVIDDSTGPPLARRFVVRAILALLVVPGIVFFALQARFGTPVVRDWLPSSDPTVQTYDAFRAVFGSDEFLLLAWPGCSAKSPELELATAALRSDPVVDDNTIEIVSSGELVDALRANDPALTPAEAIKKLAGVGCGRGGEGYLTIKLAPESALPTKEVIDRIQMVVSESTGVSANEQILVGEPYQVTLIDQSSRDTIARYVLPSSIGALLVAWFCIGSFRLTGSVFVFAGLGQASGLALIALWLGEMSAVLVVLPTLVFMLTLSAAVHLANYYADAAEERVANPEDGVDRSPEATAFLLGWKPCVLATVTTAFGFASLAASSVHPVRQFGTLAAAGALFSTGLLLLGYPAAVWLAHRRWFGQSSKSVRGGLFVGKVQGILIHFIASAVTKYSGVVSLLGVLLFAVAIVGVPRLTTSTEFTDMFSPESKAVRDLNWVTERIGPIATLDVLVATSGRIDEDVQRVGALSDQLKELSEVGRCTDATLFFPPTPEGTGIRSTLARSVYRRKVGQAVESMPQMIHVSDETKTWKLSLSLHDLRNSNYSRVLRSIEDAVAGAGWSQVSDRRQPDTPPQPPLRHQPLAQGEAADLGNSGADTAEPSSQILQSGEFVVTGMRTVVETAHTALLRDLGVSFLTAFLLITPVMMLITRSILGGLMLMLPNTLPVAIVFGAMGWLGIHLDVASILTASVALGIAVDDTLHFVVCYRRESQCNQANEAAVRTAMAVCGPPMLHTSLICTAAMFPFLFCEFLPTSKFALLMILILSGAIVGDLVLLPALLLSRATRRLIA